MVEIRKIKRLLYFLPFPLFVACSVATAATNPKEFTLEMYERFVAAKPAFRLEIKADLELLFIDAQPGEGVINLHRIHGYCQQVSPEECETAKQEFVEKLILSIPDPELKSLRIIVRDQQYLDYLNGITGIEKLDIDRIPHRKIGEDLYAFLAYDALNTIALATEKSLREFKIEEPKAWDLAESQTREILPAIPTSDQLRASLIAFESGEYLASLLAFRDDWSKLSKEVGDGLFVTAVSDQFVVVALDGGFSDMTAFKQSIADDCAQQQRCISASVYRFSEGQWMIDK